MIAASWGTGLYLVGATGCPVVHSTLNWIVIGLLAALLATIVIVVGAHWLEQRRSATRARLQREVIDAARDRARLPGRMW